jgi:hypothetical protein
MNFCPDEPTLLASLTTTPLFCLLVYRHPQGYRGEESCTDVGVVLTRHSTDEAYRRVGLFIHFLSEPSETIFDDTLRDIIIE